MAGSALLLNGNHNGFQVMSLAEGSMLVIPNETLMVCNNIRKCRLYFTAESTAFFSEGLWSILKSSTKAVNVCTIMLFYVRT